MKNDFIMVVLVFWLYTVITDATVEMLQGNLYKNDAFGIFFVRDDVQRRHAATVRHPEEVLCNLPHRIQCVEEEFMVWDDFENSIKFDL